MNNAKIAIDNIERPKEEDRSEALYKREKDILDIIEALQVVQSSVEWSTLKRNIFDDLLSSLEKELENESRKNILNPPIMYRLQGRILWAKRYADLNKLAMDYRIELSGIRNQLKKYGKATEN